MLIRSAGACMSLYTIGHSTRPSGEFIELLQQVGVDLVVDVRSFPRSRTNPQFNSDNLRGALAEHGIGYLHLRSLGGRRGPRAQHSVNTMWRNDAFRNYADYAMTAPFRAGLEELITLSAEHSCAIMCAEALWWRCHRRIIADYLLAQDRAVAHIMASGKIDAATLTPGARVTADQTLQYAADTP
jgi:uncharacterized protein (DUF488 family)